MKVSQLFCNKINYKSILNNIYKYPLHDYKNNGYIIATCSINTSTYIFKMESIRTVLLVDDDETDSFISKRMMEISNFAEVVEIRNSGRKALNFLEENQINLNKIPELIFLDINMPLMDGFQFLDEFENLSPANEKCYIVILTGHYNLYYMSKIINNLHVISYVSKPLTEEVLMDIKLKWENIKSQ